MSLVGSLLAAFFPPRRERISELIEGRTAMVRGIVVARDLIESTLTADRCVYYHHTVEEFRQANIAGLANEGHWVLSRHDEAITEFYLQDEDGARIIVAPQNARVSRGRGVVPFSVPLTLRERALELLIQPGDLIEVQGAVTMVTDLFDHERSYREGAQRFMLSGDENSPLLITVVERRSEG